MNGAEYVAIIKNIEEFYALTLSMVQIADKTIEQSAKEMGINGIALMRILKGTTRPLRPKSLAKLHAYLKQHVPPIRFKKFLFE